MSTQCSCSLEVTGPREDLTKVAAIIEASRDWDGWASAHLLSIIIPMPDELKGICIGAAVIDGKRYEHWHEATSECPRRGISQAEQQELERKYGFPDWYTWRRRNWGPMLGTDYGANMSGASGSGLRIEFGFPHPYPPEDLLSAISDRWPSLLFRLSYVVDNGDYGDMELLGGRTVRATADNAYEDRTATGWKPCEVQTKPSTHERSTRCCVKRSC